MTKQKKENAEDCEPKDQRDSDQDGERNLEPAVEQNNDVDDGGPLSI
jgi:hypothetical protein